MNYLYIAINTAFITTKDGKKLVKIGRTDRTPDIRTNDAGNLFYVALYYKEVATFDSKDVEHKLKQKYGKYNARNFLPLDVVANREEWFLVSNDELKTIIRDENFKPYMINFTALKQQKQWIEENKE